jgi:2-polyprenyl-3-methyl-5-hydroxy-6-metoxy-1,4-benzoquinol methylase
VKPEETSFMLNNAHTSNQDSYYNHERPSIVSLIRPGRNVVLDLGCGGGAVGRKLMEVGKAAEVIGVELFSSAAEKAAKHYSKVFCGDIEELTLPFEKHFDYVLCGDILEHLKNPYALVGRIREWLKDDGTFICSLPNVRHWRVLVDLAFRGDWKYQDAGVMDRTHLRFFTAKSCLKMLEDAKFQVEHWRVLISGRRYLLLNRATFGALQEFIGPQIIAVAKKDLGAVPR